MAFGSVSIFLMSFSIILPFIFASYDLNDLNSQRQYSYYNYDITNDRIKRNAEDESKVKKQTATKKPIITPKPDTTQKQLQPKASGKFDSQENVTSTSSITLNFYENVDDNTTLAANTTINDDHHEYYNTTFYSNPNQSLSFWINITTFAKHKTVTHEMLSNSHRRAATTSLPFEFRFYGHPITNITIATGGFLYAGDHVHSWLAATQYIAALMANFDTSLSNASTIQYAHNDTTFVVQWSDVMLKDHKPEGNFTFQIILQRNGDIIFVYKDFPFDIKSIPDDNHPVKVGISDAYVIDRTVFFIRRKTVYEYHRIDLKAMQISNNTAIYFKALPTCFALESCDSCISAKISFNCSWCEAVHRCSDGFDRHRQDWITQNCESSGKELTCSVSTTPETHFTNSTHHSNDISTLKTQNSSISSAPLSNEVPDESSSSGGSSTGIVSVLVILAFLSGLTLWIFYAYKNPQSPSGQMLIKYRPTQWRWGGSEARYTAASIHM